eukprot:COSAG01_NODE_42795_length_436_cov_1.373887_1_plen_56_part_10
MFTAKPHCFLLLLLPYMYSTVGSSTVRELVVYSTVPYTVPFCSRAEQSLPAPATGV